VYASSLILGQGDDEFAAEVGDHAAPDRVESGRETTGYVSDDLLGGLEGPLAFGWCGCWYGTPDGDWKWGRFLPPSSGSTQGGTTPGVSFCVRLDPDGAATVRLVALHPLDLWNGEA
jgi:hypothetical protein